MARKPNDGEDSIARQERISRRLIEAEEQYRKDTAASEERARQAAWIAEGRKDPHG